jgi:hypothetical protein
MAKGRKEQMISGKDKEPERRRGWFWWVGAAALVIILVSAGWLAYTQRAAGSSKLDSADQIKRISAAEAKALLDRGEALIYDTRSAEAYQSKHIPQARSLPEGDVTQLASTLPKDKTLIFYCT